MEPRVLTVRLESSRRYETGNKMLTEPCVRAFSINVPSHLDEFEEIRPNCEFAASW